MNKKILFILTLPLLTGCTNSNYYDYRVSDEGLNELYIDYDKETCVEYIEYNGMYKGGLSVRYNADGTIKLNKECLERKDDDLSTK